MALNLDHDSPFFIQLRIKKPKTENERLDKPERCLGSSLESGIEIENFLNAESFNPFCFPPLSFAILRLKPEKVLKCLQEGAEFKDGHYEDLFVQLLHYSSLGIGCRIEDYSTLFPLIYVDAIDPDTLIMIASNMLSSLVKNTSSDDIISCATYLLRAISNFQFPVESLPFFKTNTEDIYYLNASEQSKAINYSDALYKLLLDHSQTASSLKHKSRCKVREMLSSNLQLPSGIDKLPLPMQLTRYMNLEF